MMKRKAVRFKAINMATEYSQPANLSEDSWRGRQTAERPKKIQITCFSWSLISDNVTG